MNGRSSLARLRARSVLGIATLVVCVGAFVCMWLPFSRRPENRPTVAAASLALALTGVALFVIDSSPNVFGYDSALLAKYVRFVLTAISLATALSAYTVFDGASPAETNGKVSVARSGP